MRSSATPSSRSRSRWAVRSWASVEQRAYPINVSVMTGSVRIAPDIRDFHRTGYLRRSRPRSQPAGRAGVGRAWRGSAIGTSAAWSWHVEPRQPAHGRSLLSWRADLTKITNLAATGAVGCVTWARHGRGERFGEWRWLERCAGGRGPARSSGAVPEQEPGVPQEGVPAQRGQVGVRAVADQAGFDGHADRGQDSAVEHKDDRGHPRKDTQQTSRPVRAA